jgi:hypothetical protein
MGFFLTILTLVIALGLAWRYLGSYMAAVFDGRVHFLGFIERPIYRMLGTSPEQEQTWKRYAGAMVIFSAVSIAFTYVIIRIQGSLPLNPQHLKGVGPALSFNTASSFVTNTNWQNYGGEDDDVVLLPDGRADRSAVRQSGRRHRGGDRHGARIRSAQFADDRQLLGRHHPLHVLHPLAHRVHRGHHLRRRGCGPDARRHHHLPRR